MYTLFAAATINSDKVLYVLEEIGAKYEIRHINVFKGENRTGEILNLNPFGKIPILEHGGQAYFESAAICRYLGAAEKSPLYPGDLKEKARVDQWIDFFNCHLGRWLTALYYEHIIKPKIGKTPDMAACEEPLSFAGKQLEVLDGWLGKNAWLAGPNLSIADFYAYAFISQAEGIGVPLNPYPNVKKWRNALKNRPSVQRAEKVIAGLT